MALGFEDDTLNVLVGRAIMSQGAVWDEMKRLELDAMRYRFLREHRPENWRLMPADVLDRAIDKARSADNGNGN